MRRDARVKKATLRQCVVGWRYLYTGLLEIEAAGTYTRLRTFGVGPFEVSLTDPRED